MLSDQALNGSNKWNTKLDGHAREVTQNSSMNFLDPKGL